MPRLFPSLRLLALASVALFAATARADSPLEGRWSQSAMVERYTVKQWFGGCGPAPVGGTAEGGGGVTVHAQGDELAFVGGSRTFTTAQCWDQMPTLSRVAHSRASSGRGWTTRCATPAGDPRRATVTTSVTATSDTQISIFETGHYEITISEGTCIADAVRSRSLSRAAPADAAAPATSSVAPTPTPPPTPTPTPTPPPSVDCSSPGDPARLEVRPSRKLMKPGESFTFHGVVQDTKGCPTTTTMKWSMDKPGSVTVDAFGKVSVPADAPEDTYDVTVTAAGKSTRVTVEVAAAARYDELLAQSGLNPQGEREEPSFVVISTGSIGGGSVTAETGAARRRLVFISVVSSLALVLGVIALIGMRRSRRAAAIEREAEERNQDRMREFEARQHERERAHAAQMRAHLESVAKAQAEMAAYTTEQERLKAGPMVCPSCRTEYPPGAVFCPKDANRLIPIAGHEEVLQGPSGNVCPTCRRGFNPGVKTCPHDGDELVPISVMSARAPESAAPTSATRGKICPTCGGRFEGNASFCGKDGTALVLLN